MINRVFDHQELELLVGRTHARVMNYDFERIQNIEFQKHGNKIVVGF